MLLITSWHLPALAEGGGHYFWGTGTNSGGFDGGYSIDPFTCISVTSPFKTFILNALSLRLYVYTMPVSVSKIATGISGNGLAIYSYLPTSIDFGDAPIKSMINKITIIARSELLIFFILYFSFVGFMFSAMPTSGPGSLMGRIGLHFGTARYLLAIASY